MANESGPCRLIDSRQIFMWGSADRVASGQAYRCRANASQLRWCHSVPNRVTQSISSENAFEHDALLVERIYVTRLPMVPNRVSVFVSFARGGEICPAMRSYWSQCPSNVVAYTAASSHGHRICRVRSGRIWIFQPHQRCGSASKPAESLEVMPRCSATDCYKLFGHARWSIHVAPRRYHGIV